MTDLPTLVAPLLLGIDWLDPQYLLDQFGDYALWGAAGVIFAECGLLIGFFLPGDSLLFTVGLLVAKGDSLLPAVAVLPRALRRGHARQRVRLRHRRPRPGRRIFAREDSRLFKKKYVDKTHEFFEKYGNRAIVLARFVPIVRTFITVMAGVGEMGFRRFMVFSAIGGALWASGVTVLGYFLGQIAFVRNNIEAMLLAIVLISVVPIGVEFLRARAAQRDRRRR